LQVALQVFPIGTLAEQFCRAVIKNSVPFSSSCGLLQKRGGRILEALQLELLPLHSPSDSSSIEQLLLAMRYL
jgi:hypothetical protein